MSYTIVVPVYNEEAILEEEVTKFLRELKKLGNGGFEIILAENGSTDKTLAVAQKLAKKYREVRAIHLSSPGFGKAFRAGAEQARYPHVFLMNADWLDKKFVQKALPLLGGYAIVVGSKVMRGSKDQRPILRRLGSFALTNTLKFFFGYSGTDSHGLKAFRRKELLDLLSYCVSDEVIESELLVRASRANYPITEVPVSIKEMRPPRLSFYYRALKVLKELFQLYLALHQPVKPGLHADDLGLNKEVNQAALEFLRAGRLASVSVLANWPQVGEAAQILRQFPTVEVFLHFNLVEGKSLAAPAKSFDNRVLFAKLLLRLVDPAEVKRELLAQLERLSDLGLKVSGIDGHQHMHALSPIAEVVTEVAREKGIKHVRSYKLMKTQSLLGSIKLTIFRLVAFWTHLISYGQPILPITWRISSWRPFSVASWEALEPQSIKASETIVFHPGLPYDRRPITK